MRLLGAKRLHQTPLLGQPTPDESPTAPSDPVATRPPIDPAARSCCCPSEPVAQVLLPGRDGRPAQQILLCAHHLRASADRLRALEAAVHDQAGLPVSAPAKVFALSH